jgi:hypothetical protein
MDTNSDTYKFIASLNKIRKEYTVSKDQHIERWCDDKFYAFTRGKVFVAVTNDDSGAIQERSITYHPYSPG